MSIQTASEAHIRGGKTTKVERYKWTVRDIPGKMGMVDKTDLNVDDSYQRDDLAEPKILRMASEWSWVACGVLVIAERGGKFWVIDGQHRLKAALRRDDIKSLPCIRFETDSEIEEALGFIAVNTNRRPMSAADKHRALLCAEDAVAIDVQKLADSARRKVSKQSASGTIACVGLLRRLVIDNKERIFNIWPLLRDLCKGHNMNERVVDGLYYIETRLPQGDSIMDSRWAKRIEHIGFDRLLAGANRAAALYAKGGAKVYARGMLETINSGLQRRLMLKEKGRMTDWAEALLAAKAAMAEGEKLLALGKTKDGTEALYTARLRLWDAIDAANHEREKEMSKSDGGPAFPRLGQSWTDNKGTATYSTVGGMSLRDWFAGQALAGCVANPVVSEAAASRGVSHDDFHSAISIACYKYADAMLAEREKP